MKKVFGLLMLGAFLFCSLPSPAHAPPKFKTENVSVEKATIHTVTSATVASAIVICNDATIRSYGIESTSPAITTLTDKEVLILSEDRCRSNFEKNYNITKESGHQKISVSILGEKKNSLKVNRMRNSRL